MKKIFFVTTNKGKIMEASELLAPYGIEVEGKEIELSEPRDDDIEAIARGKALQALKAVKAPLVAEDTGIFFEEYNNFPGAYAKKFVSSVGIKGVLRLLQGAGTRKAFFQTSVAFAALDEEPRVFTGKCLGKIVEAQKGVPKHEKLPYDSLFAPDEEEKTFAEMTGVEKARYSHRAKAFRAFGEWYATPTQTE